MHDRDNVPGPGDPRPAIFPAHRQQECLAARIVQIIAIGSHRQEGHPPFAILGLDHVGVSGRGDRIGPVARQVALGEDRIAFIGGEGAHRLGRAQHDLRMAFRGPALGRSHVIMTVFLEDMGPFDPDRLFREIDTAIDQQLARTNRLLRLEIELLDPDRPVPVILRPALRRAVVENIGLPVIVEED